MKNICLDLRGHATKIINYEKKRNIINKWRKIHCEQRGCYICKKDLVLIMTIKNSEIIVTILENIEELLTIFIIVLHTIIIL